MKKLCLLAAVAFAVSSQAAIIDSQFVNLDFDASTQDYFPGGFDNAAYDIPGWQDAGPVVDSGIESAPWWGNLDTYSAFLGNAGGGDSAMNISSYTIQSGDVYQLTFYAKSWSLAANNWGVDGDATLTMSLFYGGDTANVIGSYTTPVMINSNDPADYAQYRVYIPATVASEGQSLGVMAQSAGFFANFDEVTINVVPEPATMGLVGAFGAGLLFIRRRFRL